MNDSMAQELFGSIENVKKILVSAIVKRVESTGIDPSWGVGGSPGGGFVPYNEFKQDPNKLNARTLSRMLIQLRMKLDEILKIELSDSQLEEILGTVRKDSDQLKAEAGLYVLAKIMNEIG